METDVQTHVVQEMFGRLGKATQEDVYRFMDLVVELAHG